MISSSLAPIELSGGSTLAGSSSGGIWGLCVCGDMRTAFVKMKGLNTERCGSGVAVNQWTQGRLDDSMETCGGGGSRVGRWMVEVISDLTNLS